MVAIKILRPERQGSVIQSERFLAEAKKVAKLSHKNIVAVHDVGRDSGLCYMVTDLINGRDLAQLLKKDKVAAAGAVRIVTKIADALQHAHENGVIHRDVKPHNILLDRKREPFITDFGIAVTDVELQDGGSDTAGTPAYMAPEQADLRNPVIDRRCDIYSLGIVLHELLVGTVPYEATTLGALRSRHNSDPVSDLTTRNPEISLFLNDVCTRAIASNPDKRWQSAREFADQLREVLKQHPYNRPTSLPIKRFVSPLTASKLRRQKIITGAKVTLIVFTLVVILFCTGILQYVGDIGAKIPEVVTNETSEDKQPRLYAAGRMALFAIFVVVMLARASAILKFFHGITEQLFETLRK